jgi:hypothetical protein
MLLSGAVTFSVSQYAKAESQVLFSLD